MSKLEFIQLCEINLVDPGIAIENKLIRSTLRDIQDKKINFIKGQLLINLILKNDF